MRFVYALILALAPAWGAAHNRLLPQPREVRYGAGSLPLDGLAVRFASSPGPEDRFAARELAAGLSAAGQTFVPVADAGASTAAVVLNRTGDPDPLPKADERTGPDAREAYTLTVTPRGAEIRARSSAGIYYGVQTLLQMVEGSGGAAALPAVEIRDWPALPYRGFMMDLSHGQLLRVSEIERQIDLLARFKANQYYFYSEASIELDGYGAGQPRGPLHRGTRCGTSSTTRASGTSTWCRAWNSTATCTTSSASSAFPASRCCATAASSTLATRRCSPLLDGGRRADREALSQPVVPRGLRRAVGFRQDWHRGRQGPVPHLYRRAAARGGGSAEARQAPDVLGRHAERRAHLLEPPRADRRVAQRDHRGAMGL